MDSNEKVLKALGCAESADLEVGRESFVRLWREHNFRVKTFQEAKALTGVNFGCLNELVSIRIPGLSFEVVKTIPF